MAQKTFLVALLVGTLACGTVCMAQPTFTQAPANLSWLPHGYGANMYTDQTIWSNLKGLHGFRISPSHIGCWSEPLWGWDVNGFYQGPQVPVVDPVNCQLPIGLIYPSRMPAPPPPPHVRKVSAGR